MPSRGRSRKARAGAGVLVVALVAVGGVITWRMNQPRGSATGMATTTLLASSEHANGPVAALNTAASVEDSAFRSEPWKLARTGADDRQLVVYLDGAGCEYGATVESRPERVTVRVRPAPAPGVACALSLRPIALGVDLPEPLAGRLVSDGTADRPVVDGRQLAAIAWPPGASRSSTESLTLAIDATSAGGTAAFDGRWTWRIESPSPPLPPNQAGCHDGICTATVPDEKARLAQEPLRLTQDHPGPGGAAIDDATAAYACSYVSGYTTSAVDLDGTAATFVTCLNGTTSIWWRHGDDRVALVDPDPVARGVDRAALVALARQVRFG